MYQSEEVINKELAGYKVLESLISEYAQMAERLFTNSHTNYDNLLLKSLPATIELSNDSLYHNLLHSSIP